MWPVFTRIPKVPQVHIYVFRSARCLLQEKHVMALLFSEMI
jgi:hypothetical protein